MLDDAEALPTAEGEPLGDRVADKQEEKEELTLTDCVSDKELPPEPEGELVLDNETDTEVV